jgi:tetratricopeptide (TPR) repeat protein
VIVSKPISLRTLAALLALAVAASASNAAADAHGDAHAAAAESPEYKRTIEAALDEYRLQHFEEARTLFQRAHGLEPSARTERGLGMVEFELRHYVEAQRHLEAAINSTAKPLTEEQKRSAQDLLSRTRQFVAQYALEVEPRNSELVVELDGKAIDARDVGHVSLTAGEHSLRISSPDHVTRELVIDVKGGEQQTLRIQLEVKNPTAPATAEGTAPRQDLPAVVRSEPRRSRLALALAAPGAGLALVGGAIGGVALAKAGSADSRDGAEANTAKTLALASDITVGVGVAAVIAGGIIWLVQRPSGEESGPPSRVSLVGDRLFVRF